MIVDELPGTCYNVSVCGAGDNDGFSFVSNIWVQFILEWVFVVTQESI